MYTYIHTRSDLYYSYRPLITWKNVKFSPFYGIFHVCFIYQTIQLGDWSKDHAERIARFEATKRIFV